jgi:polysaccharide deacetylase 2 family uncharacterized protein YibQ
MGRVTLLLLLVLAAAPAASKVGERVTIGFIIDDLGNSLAIGHPRPVTLAALEHWLPQLAERGIRLTPLTTRLAQHSPEAKPWRASWSH